MLASFSRQKRRSRCRCELLRVNALMSRVGSRCITWRPAEDCSCLSIRFLVVQKKAPLRMELVPWCLPCHPMGSHGTSRTDFYSHVSPMESHGTSHASVHMGEHLWSVWEVHGMCMDFQVSP